MKTLLVAVAAVGLVGCVVHATGYVHHPAPVGEVVVVERVHVHGAGCGHYWYNGAWYYQSGHVHGSGCGHVFIEGHWVLSAPVVVEKVHVHDAHCGHYFCGGTWYYMHAHHHGPGCGHHWDGHVWVAVRL